MTDIVLSSTEYKGIHGDIIAILEGSRRAAERSVNAVMTAIYWEVGRRVVEFEQGGEDRAAYGRALLVRLSGDLTKRFGRGFGVDNLELMRLFYQTYSPSAIFESLIRKSDDTSARPNSELVIRKFDREQLSTVCPLSWTHCAYLMRRTRSTDERTFYETEALRGGWSVRKLYRQISSQFYTPAMLSNNKRTMLEKGSKAHPIDFVTPEDAIKDPYVLEFLDLKDEYSESQLEARSFIG